MTRFNILMLFNVTVSMLLVGLFMRGWLSPNPGVTVGVAALFVLNFLAFRFGRVTADDRSSRSRSSSKPTICFLVIWTVVCFGAALYGFLKVVLGTATEDDLFVYGGALMWGTFLAFSLWLLFRKHDKRRVGH